MEYVFILEHVYDTEDEEEVKFIGAFSSHEKAQRIIDQLKDKPGFKDHPVECFQIHQTKVDRCGWGDGFTRL